jgi:hypothetical protein
MVLDLLDVDFVIDNVPLDAVPVGHQDCLSFLQ